MRPPRRLLSARFFHSLAGWGRCPAQIPLQAPPLPKNSAGPLHWTGLYAPWRSAAGRIGKDRSRAAGGIVCGRNEDRQDQQASNNPGVAELADARAQNPVVLSTTTSGLLDAPYFAQPAFAGRQRVGWEFWRLWAILQATRKSLIGLPSFRVNRNHPGLGQHARLTSANKTWARCMADFL